MGKSQDDAVTKLRELIDDVDTAMFTTVSPEGRLVSRPLQTQQVGPDGRLWFMTDRRTHKVDEIAANPRVNVAYASSDQNTWVSVSGRAEVVRDQAKIDEVWSAIDRAIYPGGKSDPDIALICVEVETAEYWDGPSTAIGKALSFAQAMLDRRHEVSGQRQSLRP